MVDQDLLLVLDSKRKRLSSEVLGKDVSLNLVDGPFENVSASETLLGPSLVIKWQASGQVLEERSSVITEQGSKNMKEAGAGIQTHLQS